MNEKPLKEPSPEEKPLTFWQIAGSAAAAAFGVQSRANRERDFSRGKPLHFIIAGIVFTIVFVVIVASVVRFVLHSAASSS
ncbi:MAG TPA: DUF2970 domain-containing protein [Pseudomonadales bacterium]|jgi:uncharacterized membrane protein YhdT|nr:DUF2970 domain-containing protein [Pseudomonadales bacterium]